MPDHAPCLAVIVPYRDRQRNLHLWLDAVSRYEPLARLNPSIHVICQGNTQLFNRGRLLNIGFSLASGRDYYCFHDVDLIPVSADYSFCNTPAHLSARVSQFGYQKPYETLFGGVTLFTGSHFTRINGFSNQYLGWGGEDDDILIRCRRAGLEPEWRDGIYYSLSHHADYGGAKPNHDRNVARLHSFERCEVDHQHDGLSNLSYTLLATDSLATRYAMPVTIHHVCFNNRDFDAQTALPPAYLKPSSNVRPKAPNGCTVKNPEDGREVRLNEQAAAVLQFCDGTNTIDRITRLFSGHFLKNIYDIECDVPRTVEELADLGLCDYLPPMANDYIVEPMRVGSRTITVTTHNRPEYLRGMLESLAENDTGNYHLVLASEPGCEEARELIQAFPHPAKTILYNPVKLGVRHNPYSVLDYIFTNGASFDLYLEEDLELAIDAVDLADWFRTLRIDTEFMCLCLHNGRREIDAHLLDKVYMTRGFSSLGVALKKTAWDNWLKHEWFSDEHCKSDQDIGWDHSIRALVARRGLKILSPICSRTRHTGRYGVHCHPELQDRMLEDVKINRIRRVKQYDVVDG